MRKRSFSRPRHMAALSEINVTPLLDLCFCLLIIFMIATPVLEQTTQIDLPLASKTIATPPSPTPQKPRIVSLDNRGNLVFDGQTVTEAALRNLLRDIARLPEAQQPVIRVRADGALPIQRLIDLFSLVKESNLSKVSMDTEVRN
ncbi:MAG: biopolymer transporter ExbD [Puniceicoccales bacterium]|jgi:biopolymer transport protein ExbD|nr:biopolymer transporter ExbD [Puniceicoccales bacterium]